jgi:hypothetical protein
MAATTGPAWRPRMSSCARDPRLVVDRECDARELSVQGLGMLMATSLPTPADHEAQIVPPSCSSLFDGEKTLIRSLTL